MDPLFYQHDYWQTFPKGDKDTVAKDLHPSWDATTQSYKEITYIHPAALEIIKSGPTFRALDFGIGMGRNYDYLKTVFQEVYSFDTEIMVKNIQATGKNIDVLTANWRDILANRYNVVFECTVFQHMPPQEVLHRLMCIAQTSPYLYSITRSYNDFFRNGSFGGVNMFKLVEATNLFDVAYCSIPIEEAQKSMDERHFHVLWQTKKV